MLRSALVVLFLLVLAAPAEAKTRTLTLRSGPVQMGGYNVEFPKVPIKAPEGDGYVRYMTASLVDSKGRAITIKDVMLHHLVIHRAGKRPELGPCTSKN